MHEYPLRIIVRESSIEQSSSGNILGVVYWQWKTDFFPDFGWDDFIVVLLGWWIQNIVKLLTRASFSEEMYFMEGPYKVLCKSKEELLCCQFIRHDKEVVGSINTTMVSLSSSMIEAAKTVLAVCHRNEFYNSDVKLLIEKTSNLERLLLERI